MAGKIGVTARPAAETASGASMAVIVAAAVSLLTLAIVQVATVLDDGFKETVHDLGKTWVPNAEGIGPYAGKETITLVVWVASWIALHLAWRHRELQVRPWFWGAAMMLVAATVLIWPPVWHWIEG